MNLIVARDKNNGIGFKGGLLYCIPDDLKYFKEKTLNKVVVMGYNTLLSLPKSSPLPHRTNIVLSKDRIDVLGAEVVTSLEELFGIIKKYNTDDIFVMGGQSVYTQLAPYCDYAFITEIDCVKDADAFLDIGKRENWEKVEESIQQECNDIKYSYCKYKNLKKKAL